MIGLYGNKLIIAAFLLVVAVISGIIDLHLKPVLEASSHTAEWTELQVSGGPSGFAHASPRNFYDYANDPPISFVPNNGPAQLTAPSQIVFQTDRGVNGDKIYVMDSDGSNPTDILNDSTSTSSDLTPAWSADGTKIAFSANRSGPVTPGFGPHDTWAMDADGSNLLQITFGGQFGIGPAWSYDVTRIAYRVTTTPNQLRAINSDGSGTGQTQLTTSAGGNFSASWSPDDTKIMFSSRRDGNDQIYVMDANGANQTRITFSAGRDVNPDWCAGGDLIAFASDRVVSGDFEIWVMNSDGTGQTQLTDSPGNDNQPSWSSDCTQIAFASDLDGDFDIYVMDADGTDRVNITNNTDQDSAPDWFGIGMPTDSANDPPEIAVDNSTVVVNEGQTANNSGTVTDPDSDPVTLTASAGTVINNGDETWSWSLTTTDGPSESQTVTISGDDGQGGDAFASFDLTVNNVPPIVGAITAPIDPLPVGTTVNTSASFTDAGTGDTHTASWDWGDNTSSPGTVVESGGSGTVGGGHDYAQAGVYEIELTVFDQDDGSGTSVFQFVVLFDPDGGFVTGGGWINSPAGAYVADVSATGKANFGFVSKYKNGASTPSGQTEFNFKAGDLNFHS